MELDTYEKIRYAFFSIYFAHKKRTKNATLDAYKLI